MSDAESRVTTPVLGASFASPEGWAAVAEDRGIVLTAPEGDLALRLVDIASAATGEEATALARAAASLDPARPVRVAAAEAPRQGWAQVFSTLYEPAEPGRWEQASAFGTPEGWTVAIVEGSMATFEMRAAAVMLVLQSLHAPGHRPEDVSGVTPRRLDRDAIAEILDFLREAMDRLAIPGIGIALVEGEDIVFEGGLGVRSVETGGPVDADTLFAIASNTKGLTTLLLASLVDEGRLAWDAIAHEVFPAFRLGDPALTDRIAIRHLVSAATGLPRSDLVWSFTNRADTPASRIFEMLEGETPTSGFGEVYQYNNLMAAAAGFIGGAVAHPELDPGTGYDLALSERIFGPLGMESTTFDRAEAWAGNHAALHGQDAAGRTIAVDPGIAMTNYASRPSGGAWSSAHDLIRYVRLELLEGRLPGGRQLVSRENLLARRAPGVAMGANAHYGMGLVADREAGVSVIHHGGSTPGAMSDILVLPEAGIGAVLLTNADSGMFLLPAFKRRLVEVLYGAAPKAAADVAAAAQRIAADLAQFNAATRVPPPGRLPARYSSDALGDLWTEGEGEGLLFRFASIACPMRVRDEPDGSLSYVTAHPVLRGFAFTAPPGSDAAELVIRESQRAYRFRACLEEQAS
ncbi:serine hydrolase domain-containing protein [Erythrobacter sp. NE805]|uniref:serine hydrolase domain-containing protein n=1 Tax=Erythrobacter sp. NE805 TaxID=3389875 RepID=UPI00396B0E20